MRFIAIQLKGSLALFKVFLFLIGFLPAGSFFGFELTKYFLFFVLMILIFKKIKHNTLYNKKVLVFWFSFFIYIVYCLFVSTLSNDVIEQVAIYQFNGFIFFLMSFLVLFCLVEYKEEYPKYIIYGYFLLSLFKVITYIIVVIYGLNLQTVIEPFLGNIFNVNPIIAQYSTIVSRIQFQNDFLVFPSLFYIMFNRNIKYGYFIGLIIFLSFLISYSRYFYFVFVFILIYWLFLNKITLKRMLLVTMYLSLLFYGMYIYHDLIFDMIKYRFSSQGAQDSNSERINQFYYLVKAIADNPLFGNGLGFYIKDYIRSTISLYSYEMEIISNIMQIGFFGSILYFILIFSPFFNFKCNINYIFIMLLYLLSIATGFSNPILLSYGFIGLIYIFYGVLTENDRRSNSNI